MARTVINNGDSGGVVRAGLNSMFTELYAAATAGATPTTPTDFKDSVVVATTANIALTGEQTIDGVLTSGSRVLVKDQTTQSANGIYVSAAGAWSRATDADTNGEITPGMLVLVESGTANGDQIFICTNVSTITIGTTAITFQAIAVPTTVFVGKTVAGTTYTTILGDSARRLYATNAAAKTITVAPQSSVNAAVNTEIEVVNIGAGLLTIAPGSGVTINSLNGILTLPQYAGAKLKKRANPNTWELTNVSVVRETFPIAIGDETTAITTGTAKVTFRMPYAFRVLAVRASLTTASSSGIPTFDINEGGTTILSTKLTIDANEKTSTTAATPAVISDANLADDAEITIDVDVAGTGAAGAKIYITGVQA